MKKIILIFCLIIPFRINAIENIEINNELLIPKFQNDIKVYNYYTDDDQVNIYVKKTNDEDVFGDGSYYLEDDNSVFKIYSSNNEEYIIKVFRNYNKNNKEECSLKKLYIENYEIEFQKDIYEYSIDINKEEKLNISYELSNDECYVSIEGNGNFNDIKNEIIINVNNNQKYIINVYKTKLVSFINEEKIVKQMSYTKKEIVALIIITISCILVFLFSYFLFIYKTTFHI